MNAPINPVLTFTVTIDEQGNVWNDTQTHGRTFAEVYRAFHSIKSEVDRQIRERRNCPYNPLHGVDHPVFVDESPEVLSAIADVRVGRAA